MAYDKRTDCANSNRYVSGVYAEGDVVECSRCHQPVPVSPHVFAGHRGGWLLVHLRPGKTLADRQ